MRWSSHRRILRAMQLRTFLWLASLTTAGACTSLRIEDDDGGSPADPPLETPECFVDPDSVLELYDVTSATLFGDTLHVQGQLEGESAYAVLRLVGSNAELHGARPDLAGGASWTLASEGHYVRVLGSRLDVLNASSPADASIVSSIDLEAAPPVEFAGIGVDGDAIYLCVQAPTDEAPILSRIDLSDPLAPGAPTHVPPPSDWNQANYPCNQFGKSGLAEGALQLLFDGSNMMLFDLRTSTITESHGFVTDGVHHYGEFNAIETDGRVVATTLENDAYAFLYYADDVPGNPQPWGSIVYSSFGGGEKRLLEVVTGRAVLAVPGDSGIEIVARDIEPAPAFETAAETTDMRVALIGGSDQLDDYRVLTHDDTRLVISDREQLFVVPVGGSEPVTPLVLTEAGSEPVCL
jgi:hypothetical protein